MRHVLTRLVLLGLVLALGACVCSPGYVGGRGYYHPGYCV